MIELEMDKNIVNNRYQIVNKIGEGGMGISYLVKDILRSDQEFALKSMRSSAVNELILKNFKKEFDVMTRLKHPHLARVHDFGFNRQNKSYFIIMEFVKGITLEELLSRDENLSLDSKLAIIISLLRTIEFIHSRSILHRDIKPANIMITNDECSSGLKNNGPNSDESDCFIKVMDFGLSDLEVSEDYKSKGTLLFMAPEVIRGKISNSVDIFSAGITFFEILTGVSFYGDKHSKRIFKAIVEKKIYDEIKAASIKKIEKSDLRDIVDRMIAYYPEDRYCSCTDIILEMNQKLGKTFDLETSQTKKAYVLGASFIGRNNEIKRLSDWVGEKESQILLVHGETGIGKSRLFQEFKHYCQLHGLIILEGSCSESIPGSFNCFIPLLNEALLYADRTIILRYGPDLKRILPKHLQLKDTRTTTIKDPEIVHSMIIQSITGFILEFVRKENASVILMVHDVQWIDEASIEVLEELMYKLAQPEDIDLNSQLRVIASCRPEGIKTLQNLMERERLAEIHLRPFSESHVRDFIQAIFGENTIDNSLKNEIPALNKKVGGNPFFLQELVKSMVDMDFLYRAKKGWTLDKSINSVKVPLELKEIIRTHLETLNLPENNIKGLQVLALIDRSITWEELNRIIPIEIAFLSFLEQIEIVKSQLLKMNNFYSILHNLIREVIMEQIPCKQLMHQFIAEQLETIHKNDLQEYFTEITHHFSLSEKKDKAIYYLEKTGDLEKKRYNNQLALTFYHKLLDFLDADDEELRIDTLLKIASIYDLTGKWDDSETIILEALKRSEKIDDKVRVGISKIAYGNNGYRKRDCMKALEYFHYALDIFTSLNDNEKIVEIYNNIGNVQLAISEYNEALNWYKKSLLLAEKTGNKHHISISSGNIALVYSQLNEYKTAMKYHAKQLRVAKQLGDKKSIANSILNIGVMHHDTKKYNNAIRCYTKNLEYFLEIGYKQGISSTYNNLAILYFIKGDYNRAMDIYKKRLRISEELGDKHGISITMGNIGLLYSKLGHYNKAVECHGKHMQVAEKFQDKLGISMAFGNLGSVFLDIKDFTKAIDYFDKALAISEKIGRKSLIVVQLLDKAKTLLELKKSKQAKKLASRCSDIAHELEEKDTIISCEILQSKIKFFDGNHDVAIKNLRELLETENLDDEDIAIVNDELWKMSNSKICLKKALEMYESLYETKQDIIFRNRIMELRKIENREKENIDARTSKIDLNLRKKTVHDIRIVPKKPLESPENINQASIREPGQESESMSDHESEISVIHHDRNISQDAQTLLNILLKISANLDLDELLNTIIDSTIKLSNADRGFIILLDDLGEWIFKAGRNVEQQSFEGEQETFQISRSVVQKVIDIQEPVFVDDTSLDLYYSTQKSIVHLEILSIICIPLISRTSKTMMGVLYVDSNVVRKFFNKYDMDLLVAIANQASISIENAQLFDKTQQDHNRLGQLYDEIKKLDTIKSKFISLASHELRTPLTILMGNMDILTEALRHKISISQLHKLDIARNSVDRLHSITDRILNLARLDTTEVSIDMQAQSLTRILYKIEEEVKSLILNRDLTLKLELPENELIAEIHTNSFWQIVMNLILNAIRFTQDGGLIILGGIDKDEYVEISVKDTGIGIQKDEYNNIFKSFYKIQEIKYHSSGTTEFKSGGLGVGLTIVRSAVELHNGKIRIESEPGKGTTFIVSFPKDQLDNN